MSSPFQQLFSKALGHKIAQNPRHIPGDNLKVIELLMLMSKTMENHLLNMSEHRGFAQGVPTNNTQCW